MIVESTVDILSRVGYQLNPKVSATTETSSGQLTRENAPAVLQRSGRAVKNAASICNANPDMLAAYLERGSDSPCIRVPVEVLVVVLNAYSAHLSFDENIEDFEAASNPFLFQGVCNVPVATGLRAVPAERLAQSQRGWFAPEAACIVGRRVVGALPACRRYRPRSSCRVAGFLGERRDAVAAFPWRRRYRAALAPVADRPYSIAPESALRAALK